MFYYLFVLIKNCIFKGNHINDSGPPQQQHLQHPSNHNMMGSLCGPGNNGLIGMSNHGSGPIGPGMLMNNSNSNSSMMGGPGSILNQPGTAFKFYFFLLYN